MVIKRADRRTRHVTNADILQIPAFSQMTLGKSRILFVYENLFKTFGFIYVTGDDISASLVIAITSVFVT